MHARPGPQRSLAARHRILRGTLLCDFSLTCSWLTPFHSGHRPTQTGVRSGLSPGTLCGSSGLVGSTSPGCRSSRCIRWRDATSWLSSLQSSLEMHCIGHSDHRPLHSRSTIETRLLYSTLMIQYICRRSETLRWIQCTMLTQLLCSLLCTPADHPALSKTGHYCCHPVFSELAASVIRIVTICYNSHPDKLP